MIFTYATTYSTFGNDLEPTSHWLEVMFSICIVLAGLLLFTLLIGNIQVITCYFYNIGSTILFFWRIKNLKLGLYQRYFCMQLWQRREKCSWDAEIWNGGWNGDSCRLVSDKEFVITNAKDGQLWEEKMRWTCWKICQKALGETSSAIYALISLKRYLYSCNWGALNISLNWVFPEKKQNLSTQTKYITEKKLINISSVL